jgi:hypothetical protein
MEAVAMKRERAFSAVVVVKLVMLEIYYQIAPSHPSYLDPL